MRSLPNRPLNRDEWPNLALLEHVPRSSSPHPARLPQTHPDRLLRARLIAAAVFLIGALIVRACLPGYIDAPSVEETRD
jgi:hypothetical protein